MHKLPVQKIMAASATLALQSPAWAQVPPNPDRYAEGPHMMGWGGWPGMMFGPLFMLLMFATVIAVAVLLVRWLGGLSPGAVSSPSTSPRQTPLDILQERFARGEVDKDDYEERRRILGERVDDQKGALKASRN